jgi:hypothetical protein
MNASRFVVACALLGAGMSAQAADGVVFRTARNLDLAPSAEEEVLLAAPPGARPAPEPGPVQGPGQAAGQVLKGGLIGEPGLADEGSPCTDRRYFSWFGGCCERQPSCCDNVAATSAAD